MDDIVDWFRKSKADRILFILDCCFSGQAPARILESSPISRNPINSVYELAGKGRYIISACSMEESAFELPDVHLGLLTRSIADELYNQTNSFEFSSIISGIAERVRAGASKIGVTQTPSFFGLTEGGFVLPPIIKGDSYRLHFPDYSNKTISNKISDLEQLGFPTPILSIWDRMFSNGLNELQMKAINEHKVLEGESLLVVAPTSAGKTFVGELASVKAVSDGKKTVFLLPYKALVNEKYEQFNTIYSSNGLRIIRVSGDYLDDTGAFLKGKYDISVMTYELFLSLITTVPSILNDVGLVVVDEAQFITDPNRGITIELLLTYLITPRAKGMTPQIIALSAVIGHVNEFDGWLSCNKLVYDKRPVPLIEGVLDRSGRYQYMDTHGNVQIQQLLPPYSIQVRKDKPSSQDVIVPLVKQLVSANEKVLVFRNNRGSAQGCANYLANDLALPGLNDGIVGQLPKNDLSNSAQKLIKCLSGGTAFHNANLTREEKQIVEKSFGDPESNIKVLVATTTVAAGINTPASTVIIAEQEFRGEDGREFTVAEYKNMAGRAGRLGYQEEGKVIILASTPLDRERLFKKYVQGSLENLNSSFDTTQINTWLVRLLAQVRSIPISEVTHLLSNTYGGYIANKQTSNWHSVMEQQISFILDKMHKLELIEYEGEYLQLSLLGKAVGRSSLQYDSALRLVEILKQAKGLTVDKLIALVQMLPESDSGYTPMVKGRKESIRVSEASQRFGPDIIKLLSKFANDELDFWARCKRSSMLWDWINGDPIEEIESRYSPNQYSQISYGDIRKFADNTRYHLRSAFQIYSVIFMGEELQEVQMENILKRLETGLPEDCLSLLELPHSFTRGEYLILRNAGVQNSEDYRQFKQQYEISSLFSKERVAQLQLS